MSSANDNPPPGTYNPSDMDSQNGSYILSNFKTLGTKRIVPLRNNPFAMTQQTYGRTGRLINTLHIFSDTWTRHLLIAKWLRSPRLDTIKTTGYSKSGNLTARKTKINLTLKHVRDARQSRFVWAWHTTIAKQISTDASSTKVYDAERPNRSQHFGGFTSVSYKSKKERVASWVRTTSRRYPFTKIT